MRGMILFALAAGTVACSTLAGFEDLSGTSGAEGGSGASSGGDAGTASGTGGSEKGGVSSGGTDATGGVAGTARGGASTGGDANGGTDGGTSGNASTGGSSTGGTPTGGSSTGGTPTGGSSTGGTATGGTATGGTATGGSGGVAGAAGAGGAGAGGAAGAAGCGQLLVNGGFAAGRGAPWQELANWPAGPLIVHRSDAGLTSRSVAPQSDDYLAWLGGDPEEQLDHHMQLWQVVTIPMEATSLTVTGFVWVATAETDQNTQWDHAYIDLRTDDEEWDLLWSFKHWSNRDAGSGWMPITNVLTPTQSELAALRGRTLLFMVHTVTDETGPTHFWFDSLALVAGCGR